MDYSRIDSFNQGFRNKKVQEMLELLPASLRMPVKEALECEQEADFEQEEEIFREILRKAEATESESVQSLLSMIYGKLLRMDLENTGNHFSNDRDAYLAFLDSVPASDALHEDLVQNLTVLSAAITDPWKRSLYAELLELISQKGYLSEEKYAGILPSAKASLESYEYLEDRNVSQLMRNVLKSFYEIQYTIHEEEDIKTDEETIRVEALLSKWMLCCYESGHRDELAYIEQKYPNSFALMQEFILQVREDAEAAKEAVLADMMSHTIDGTEKEQVDAAAKKLYEDLLKQGFEPRRVQQTGRTNRRTGVKIGRNDPCPCGSGRKYKQCCGK